MIEPPNGNGPVTLGEVYRAVLRVEHRLDGYIDGHDEDHAPSGTALRWAVGIAFTIAGLALTIAGTVAAAP